MGSERSVMIVDDEAVIRLTVSAVLNDAGLEVVEADGTEQCLEALRGGFKGVVLMDVMMPDMDGWDAIKAIVAGGLFKGIIIVMLTAMDVPGDKMSGLQEYVFDYLTKPFTPDELIANVKEYLVYVEGLENAG